MKIEGQTLLVVGVIGVGAYLWYKFVKPVNTTTAAVSSYIPTSPIIPSNEEIGKSLIPLASTEIKNYYSRTIGGAIDVIKGIGQSIFPTPAYVSPVSPVEQARGISYAQQLYSGQNPQVYGSSSKRINDVTPSKSSSVSYTTITGQPVSKTSLTGNQTQSSLNAITARVTASYNSKKLTK
jgi:hypothetical protein